MIDQRVVDRIDRLLEKGSQVLASVKPPPQGVITISRADSQLFSAWRTQTLSFLAGTLGPDHVYSVEFRQSVDDSGTSHIKHGQGILHALREDIDGGYLSTLREVIHADVFSDFTEMAAYFIAEGYKDPAAVIAGSVLEEHLRKLCQKHGVSTDIVGSSGVRPKKADQMNADLAKAAVYSSMQQKQVTAWLGLRNDAAHGKYGEYGVEQVRLFIDGLRDFMVRTPA